MNRRDFTKYLMGLGLAPLAISQISADTPKPEPAIAIYTLDISPEVGWDRFLAIKMLSRNKFFCYQWPVEYKVTIISHQESITYELLGYNLTQKEIDYILNAGPVEILKVAYPRWQKDNERLEFKKGNRVLLRLAAITCR